jgi:hypothetical protein
MRTFRSVAGVLTLAALLPALPGTAGAQSDRLFKDSWFWGAKAGIASFSTATVTNKAAPLAGGEWMITRSRFALDLALDQAFFDETATIVDPAGTSHVVRIENLRRFSVQGFFFPAPHGALRPYAGLGFAMNLIHKAAPRDEFADAGEEMFVRDELHERKDRVSLLFTAGTQLQMGRLAPFVQASYMPSQIGFLLNKRPTYFLEAGLRLNVGSAIDKID